MKSYPALDIRSPDNDLLYAILDDFRPTAFEERDGGIRAFFAAASVRDAALGALSSRFDLAPIDVSPIDVIDDDWATRSQADLQPVRVGRFIIAPPWSTADSRPAAPDCPPQIPDSRLGSTLTVYIEPSMGFGTGHHPTTRLCLLALQQLDLANKVVVDVGTGSGILAIAAAKLGAAYAHGIDSDPDAVQSARRNLTLNPLLGTSGTSSLLTPSSVSFEAADLSEAALPRADVITANLTGALLVRSAGTLLERVSNGGCLVLGGVLETEYNEVRSAFATATLVWEGREDEWVGLTFCCENQSKTQSQTG